MIAFERIKRLGYKLISPSEIGLNVVEIREDFEYKTEKSFEEFARARTETWIRARYLVLD